MPAYAFYENGNQPCPRLGIINYVMQPSRASDLNVQIAVGGSGIGQANQSPASVKVKFFPRHKSWETHMWREGNIQWSTPAVSKLSRSSKEKIDLKPTVSSLPNDRPLAGPRSTRVLAIAVPRESLARSNSIRLSFLASMRMIKILLHSSSQQHQSPIIWPTRAQAGFLARGSRVGDAGAECEGVHDCMALHDPPSRLEFLDSDA
ncbi:hypothetical protein DXG01_017167 [Tephrocybe rancida]|nr:hypothetical protein DXG01_017167 [Tephrocybe rancida]